MNQKFIDSVILGSLLIGLLAFGNFGANAAGFNKQNNNNGTVLSTTEFYNKLEHTSPDAVAKTFGIPDNILTLRNLDGDVNGVVWTYRDAVAEENKKMDANFVLVKGNFKYVTLSKAS